MSAFNEGTVEEAALEWLGELGWEVAYGPEIGPEGVAAERAGWGDVVLEERLRDALERLNPELPDEALDAAFRRLTAPQGATTEARNREFHRLLVEGAPVEYRGDDGRIQGAQARALDFDDPETNGLLAVNQFTVREGEHTRRADIVLFVNGLPLAVIELKNPADEEATVKSAWNQLQTYKAELPTLFSLNELLIVSDGVEARIGTLTSGWEWFKPWRTIAGERLEDPHMPRLQVLLEGVCEPNRLLALLRDFIAFEDGGGGAAAKKLAGYHQFHAVRHAVEQTLRASQEEEERAVADAPEDGYQSGGEGGDPGDRRIGVVWHTQGSGKSLTMAFYAGAIARERVMRNPTIVVLTDRNDLDDQLFTTFSRCEDVLGQPPEQAESRADLRERLRRESGGVIFTTIQKFLPDEQGDRHPRLSARRNIVVIADEAHRSQYDFVDGFAAHLRDALPGASFVAFTGTPVEQQDRNTRAVFGEYISTYDIQRAVDDGATVRIYYESRLAQLDLPEEMKPQIDAEFEEVTEGEEVERKERLKTRWAQQEAVVGAGPRIRQVAADIVSHYEERCESLAGMAAGMAEGKAMVVCMSRRICVELYRELTRLRPDWHSEADEQGAIKVVTTGSASDPPDWQQHIRNKPRREALARRFRDPDDPLRVVLVRDMWLTGFDAPSLHTMYVDKPMRGHGLMQAIARVNRVFRDKPGGLVVDYLGLAPSLKQALATYTESSGRGSPTLDQQRAVDAMIERYEVCDALFYGFDRSRWIDGTPAERLAVVPAAQEHILAQEDGKERCIDATRALRQAFALAVPHAETRRIRDDVHFFQTVSAALAKRSAGEAQSEDDLGRALGELVSRAVAPQGVLDIFAAAGLDKPDTSILSDEFLAEVRGMPRRNLAVELLRKLLKGEITVRGRRNVVEARKFSELLERSLRRYQNRAIEAAEVIEELIDLAREIRSAEGRAAALGLSDAELAFYDALAVSESAVEVMGDDALREIARELVGTVRGNATLDWTMREDVRSKLRTAVKRVLRKHGYPPDQQEEATLTVLEQAEARAAELLAAA